MENATPGELFAMGVRVGKRDSAEMVKTAFSALPAGTPMATKDLLLDLYNDIKGTTEQTLDTDENNK